MTDNTPSPEDRPIIQAEELPWQDCVEPAAEAAPASPALAATPKRKNARQGTSYMAFRGEAPDADDPLLGFKPVPHVAARRNSITAARQRAFIAHLAATGIVKEAARHIGASLEALYKLRKKPGAEEFDAAWDMAVDRGVARLEDSALARAMEGEELPIVSAGKMLGTYRKHNEALVMFFLRHRRAERYGAEVGPGHPLYERIRAEVMAEVAQVDKRSEDEIYAALDAKLDAFRRRHEAAQRLLLEEGSVREDIREEG